MAVDELATLSVDLGDDVPDGCLRLFLRHLSLGCSINVHDEPTHLPKADAHGLKQTHNVQVTFCNLFFFFSSYKHFTYHSYFDTCNAS